ncbi:LysM peptidoglycan-binding domain-containing protein [Emticicia sp. W12TSBA100-4]|uniref:LysM peptidoglycan-binding domain-containing protein n=1 Tax=Emticicia sp. W12TSBA100-4 TaxID=3160965 RepID=UPI003305C51A
MKKNVALLLLLVCIQGVFAQQAILPEVPKKLEFAGVTVKLDADAQKLVQKEVNALLTPENKYLIDKLERIQWYFPIIEKILEEEEIPEDFKYIAVAESSLLPDAISTSNAVGFWQMKPTTAQEVGLRVDKEIDERKNIYSSTRGAALYLKRNNLIYKNWISSLFSYSLGATGISKIVPSQWSYANEVNFDAQTDRYLLKAIAHRIAFEYRINRLKESRFSFVEYKKTKGKSLSDIAAMANIDINELKKHNSWLLTSTIPSDKDYSVAILVPAENLEDVQSKLNRQNELATSDAAFPILKRVTVVTASEEEPIFYEINGKKGILAKPGDDVASLAKSGKMKIADFLRYNDMTDKDLVEEGKIYYLKKKDRKGPVPHHVVLTGQTMWQISQMYGIRMKNLLRLNRMNTVQRIQKGRVVYLQKKRPKDQPIEYLNGKDSEELEKVPMKEQYDGTEEKVLVKDARQPETTEKPINTTPKPTIPESVIVEESSKKPSRPSREEDDIIVISDRDDVTPAETKKAPVNPTPPASVKNTPVNPTPTTVKTTPVKTTTTPAPTTASSSSTHTVDVGQTLYSVARQYNVSVRDLAEWNNITTSERVKVGQTLIVRQPKSSTPAAVVEQKTEKQATSTTSHVVQKGETLYSISKRYGATPKQVQEWNNMADQNVKLGQKLIIKK